MKKPSLFAASMAAASATTAVTASGFNHETPHQDNGALKKKRNGGSSLEKADCCSEKFAPRFDGLRFIETLVTAHR
ncbi:hypothetical protein Hanom_Chr06g00511841 [Helianthus anomalus]